MHYRIAARSILKLEVNRVIQVLILSDFLVWSANNLMAPIFAIFIAENVRGGSIEAAGFAVAIYLLIKSLFEIPVGIYLDRNISEKDDLYTAILGSVLVGAGIISFTFVQTVWGVYAIQALLGIGNAIAFPGWYSIFTKHIDKDKEAFEWSLYDVLLGLGMAAAAAIGGLFVSFFSFQALFWLVGILTIIGALFLIMIKDSVHLTPKAKK